LNELCVAFSYCVYNVRMTRRHDYVLRVIVTGVLAMWSSRFILELMTELMLQVAENSWLSIQISFTVVFMKTVNAECALSKPDGVVDTGKL